MDWPRRGVKCQRSESIWAQIQVDIRRVWKCDRRAGDDGVGQSGGFDMRFQSMTILLEIGSWYIISKRYIIMSVLNTIVQHLKVLCGLLSMVPNPEAVSPTN